jgi:hypothetical protein
MGCVIVPTLRVGMPAMTLRVHTETCETLWE